MQTSLQGIIILPKQKAKMHLSCDEKKMKLMEMEIPLLQAQRLRHMETTTR